MKKKKKNIISRHFTMTTMYKAVCENPEGKRQKMPRLAMAYILCCKREICYIWNNPRCGANAIRSKRPFDTKLPYFTIISPSTQLIWTLRLHLVSQTFPRNINNWIQSKKKLNPNTYDIIQKHKHQKKRLDFKCFSFASLLLYLRLHILDIQRIPSDRLFLD